MKGEKMKKIILFLAIFTIGINGKHVKSNDHAEVVWETEKIFERLSQDLLCLTFHESVCSLPPDPIIKIFIFKNMI